MSLYYYCRMKFLDHRKYIFTNITAIWFYYFVFVTTFTWFTVHDKKTTSPDFVIILYLYIMLISFLVLGIILILSFIEHLITKYIIKKKFPNFKLNLKIKLPKFVIIIYNILFSIGFISACVLFLIALPFLIKAII